MPIVITRTGEPVTAPTLTQEQREALWEILLRNYLREHPEALKEEPQ